MVDGAGVLPDPRHLIITFPGNPPGPVIVDVDMFPGPDYRFPLHVAVLRGVVGPHDSTETLKLQVKPVGAAPMPSEAAMTSWRYLGRQASTLAKLPFSIGVRASEPPFVPPEKIRTSRRDYLPVGLDVDGEDDVGAEAEVRHHDPGRPKSRIEISIGHVAGQCEVVSRIHCLPADHDRAHQLISGSAGRAAAC